MLLNPLRAIVSNFFFGDDEIATTTGIAHMVAGTMMHSGIEKACQSRNNVFSEVRHYGIFRIKVDGELVTFKLSGQIDTLAKGIIEEGKYSIDDFKTVKIFILTDDKYLDSYRWQLSIYNWLLHQNQDKLNDIDLSSKGCLTLYLKDYSPLQKIYVKAGGKSVGKRHQDMAANNPCHIIVDLKPLPEVKKFLDDRFKQIYSVFRKVWPVHQSGDREELIDAINEYCPPCNDEEKWSGNRRCRGFCSAAHCPHNEEWQRLNQLIESGEVEYEVV
jgi:hypothetical protein